MHVDIEWRPVAGYEGLYEVSNEGGVRSLARVTVDSAGRSRPFPPRTFNRTPGYKGYLGVGLTKDRGSRAFRVHQLVAAAFLGDCPPGMQVAHNDGDPTNNAVSNLRYATPSEIQHDRVRHGTSNRGEQHPLAKLARSQVLEIRRLHADGQSMTRIAAMFDVARTTVAHIVYRRTWADLDVCQSHRVQARDDTCPCCKDETP